VIAQLSTKFSTCHKSNTSSSTPASCLVDFQDVGEDETLSRFWRIVSVQDAALSSNAENLSVAGRDLERSIIDTALAKSLLGISRQAVLIAGPAGHGKSTLTNEIAQKVCMANGVTMVQSAASSLMGSEMLQLWLPVIAKLLDDAHFTKENVRTCMRESYPDLLKMLPLLNHVLPDGFKYEETGAAKKLSAAAARSATINLCDALIRKLVKKIGKVVIVIEDLHWCSTIELQLLASISGIESGLMLILNTRPFEDSDSRASVLKEVRLAVTEHVELASFADSDVEALVRLRMHSVCDDSALLNEFVDIARVHAKGLPLVVHKLLDQFEELGADVFLRRMAAGRSDDDDAARRSSIANAVAIFQMDFRVLDEGTFKVLTMLAAYDDKVELDSICGVLSTLDREVILGSLLLLEEKALAVQVGGLYAIQHKIILDAVVRTAVDEDVKTLHLVIAEYMIANKTSDDGIVAYHLGVGGRPEQARTRWFSAGEHAYASGSHAEAANYLKKGFGIPPPPVEQRSNV
jgi:hypothetical protein